MLNVNELNTAYVLTFFFTYIYEKILEENKTYFKIIKFV